MLHNKQLWHRAKWQWKHSGCDKTRSHSSFVITIPQRDSHYVNQAEISRRNPLGKTHTGRATCRNRDHFPPGCSRVAETWTVSFISVRSTMLWQSAGSQLSKNAESLCVTRYGSEFYNQMSQFDRSNAVSRETRHRKLCCQSVFFFTFSSALRPENVLYSDRKKSKVKLVY